MLLARARRDGLNYPLYAHGVSSIASLYGMARPAKLTESLLQYNLFRVKHIFTMQPFALGTLDAKSEFIHAP